MSYGVSAFLAMGSTPARWQRELARRTAGVDMLRRATLWIEEVRAIGYALQSGPLFGQALIDLTTREAQPTSAHARSARRARSKPGGTMFSTTSEHYPPDVPRKRAYEPGGIYEPKSRSSFNQPTAVRVRSRSNGEGGHGDRRVRTPFTPTDTRVERDLLYQLAGGPITARSGERQPYISREGVNRYNAAGWQTTEQQQGTTGFRTIQRQRGLAALEAIARKDARSPSLQRQEFITRTRRILHLDEPSAPTHFGQEQDLLSQQWDTLIDGPTAPLELLLSSARLAERAQAPVGAGGRDSEVIGVAPEQGAMMNDERDQLRHGGETAHWNGDPLQQGDGRRMSQMFDGGDDGAQGQARQSMEHEYGRQILPPTLVSLLPPLTTPQGVSVPPLPVATATVRLGSRMEATSEEDLDVLAARIKRILDDEARRHGIDV